jgi:hypothetical protein
MSVWKNGLQIKHAHDQLWTINFTFFFTYFPDILYLRKQRYDDPWLFFEAKTGRRAKTFWETLF